MPARVINQPHLCLTFLPQCCVPSNPCCGKPRWWMSNHLCELRINTGTAVPIYAAVMRSMRLTKSSSCKHYARKSLRTIAPRQTRSEMTCISGECSRTFIKRLPISATTVSCPDTGRQRRRSVCAPSTSALRHDPGIVNCNSWGLSALFWRSVTQSIVASASA